METWLKIKEGVALGWLHVTEFVRKYPVKSFLAAAIVAFVLGYWVA